MNFNYGSHIPIFISVHDKVNQLKTSIESYEKIIKTPMKIILFNHNTTYQPCLDYLKQMEIKGYKIYSHYDENIKDTQYGNLIRKSRNVNLIKKIKEYLDENPQVNYVVITDTDLELLGGSDILDLYVDYYKKHKNIEIPIGTSLKIDDVSKDYFHYDRMLRAELPHWIEEKKCKLNLCDKEIICYKTEIDTTFKLYHREWFNNPRDNLFSHKAIRTEYPYQCKHLDWYVNENNITPDLIYYASNKSSRQSHYKIKVK